MRSVIEDLERLRRGARWRLIVQRLSIIGAWTIGGVLAFIAIDYLLRLPAALRLLISLGGLATLLTIGWRSLSSAVSFMPSLTQLALRVEQLLPALQGRLASSVEFASSGVSESNILAARSVSETESRLAGESLTGMVDRSRTLKAAGALVLTCTVFVTLVAFSPASAQTGMLRLVAPYGSAQWPARTGVVSLMDEIVPETGVFPRGESLTLRARSTIHPEDRITAVYRSQSGGSSESGWNRIVLTHQSAGVHERLIDTNLPGIDLYFETEDARTATRRIDFVPPPAIRSAVLHTTPPDYAEGIVGESSAALGPGTDNRAVTDDPILEGSHATLHLKLNKPLPVPEDASERELWLRATFGWPADQETPDLVVDKEEWTLAWTVDHSQHMDITLTDAHGLTNREPIAYRIDAMADQPPQVTITEPSGDEIVLPTALVELRAEANDDVLLHALAIEAAIEPKSPDVIPEAGWAETTSADSPATALEAVLDLQALEAKTGDVVLVTAIAEDTFDVDGVRHEPSRSTPRRLRVIDELEFASQLRRELGAVRQNAIRIEAMQAELQASIVEDSLQPGVQRAQAQIAERIADQREALNEVADRVESNRLEDAQLAELIRQSGEMLDFAGRAAGEAMSAIEDRPAAGQDSEPAGQAAESEAGEPVEAREEDQPIVEAQQEVREELTDLIELLDRDEDTWVVTRRMEGLLAEQRELQRQTRAMENRTMGRERDDLSEAERDELDRIAQRQRALRDRSQELIEELRDRAQALEPIDSQSAEGMRNAADSAEREQLDQEMEAAAEQAQQNQLRNAQSAQQSASQTLERMLDEIQEIKRARTEELVRKIQALKDSIEQLISVQENELSALARAIHEESFSGRDRAMIRLNQNTRSVAGEARSAGQETQRVARALDRAGDAQGEAITALRATPVDPAAAESAETHSLERLNEALALADAIEQQAQEEQVRQQREELIAAYRELAEREVVIHTETQGLGDGSEPLGRRALVDARLLAGRQDAVKNELRLLHDSTEQVAEALIFDHAHQMMDRWAGDVGDALREGVIGPVVTDRQQLIADSIGRLIDALEESMTPPDEFASNSQQGGGAGSGQGGEPQLIPPVSELKLLRGIQEQIYDQTKRLDADGSISDGSRRARMRDLGDQQRDLLDIGRQMMDQMNQQSRQRPAETPIEDAENNEEADS